MENALPPYDAYRVSTPFYHSKEGRWFYLLERPDGTKTSTSVARYNLAVKLGRLLAPNEQADHIDGDKTNDSPDNLQILSAAENNAKAREQLGITAGYVMLECPECFKVFERRRHKTHLGKGGAFTACSRVCAGKIRRAMQLEKYVDLSNNVISESFR